VNPTDRLICYVTKVEGYKLFTTLRDVVRSRVRGPCLKIRDSIPPHLNFEISDREPEKRIQFVTSARATNAGLRILRETSCQTKLRVVR